MTEDIPIEFPIRVRPLENVKRSENSPVPELYDIPPVAESAESHTLVATTHERVVRLVLVVARLPERVSIFPVAVAISAVLVAIRPDAERISASWVVLDPWSFWSASRIVSVAATVPDAGTNPVRVDVSTLAEVK